MGKLTARLDRGKSEIELRSTHEGRLAPPRVTPEMISHLRLVFPQQVASGKDLRDYDEMVGQQTVISYLSTLLQNQDDNG
jgi:hypothetical protein